MQVYTDNLLDYIEAHWIELAYTEHWQLCRRTPVGYYGLEAFELGGALREGQYLSSSELRWHVVRHSVLRGAQKTEAGWC